MILQHRLLLESSKFKWYIIEFEITLSIIFMQLWRNYSAAAWFNQIDVRATFCFVYLKT